MGRGLVGRQRDGFSARQIQQYELEPFLAELPSETMAVAERLLRLAVCVGGGAAVYFVALALLGVRTGDFRGATSR